MNTVQAGQPGNFDILDHGGVTIDDLLYYLTRFALGS